MSSAVNLRHHSCTINLHRRGTFSGTRFPRRILHLRHQPRCFSSLSVRSENVSPEPTVSSSSSPSPAFVSSLGSSPSPVHLSQWNFTQRHILALNVIACAVAISATWLFCSAIPTLLAFKRAAESLEKLLDVTREELPDTMAAIRLSGMEISDLTMELSDLGQEITQGIRSSTRAVRGAEEKLRRLTNMTPSVLLQEVPHPKPIAPAAAPALARSVRAIREGVMKGRTIWNIFFTFTRYSRWVFKYFSTQAK